jgi:hypothetical protein
MNVTVPVEVVAGFSKTNRWLLYTSMMLSPAQAASGVGSNCPSNLGFLAYNIYTQIQWYKAVRNKELHALSLLPGHFNTIYIITYLGGVTSDNIVMGLLLALGTAAVIVLNNVCSWVSWATNQPEGYDTFQFFFFGWRTLNDNWHKFLMVWEIADSIFTVACVVGIFTIAIMVSLTDAGEFPWWARYPAIPVGAVAILVLLWPLIMWTELIVQKNNIVSDTDWIAVWLFIAQVGAMIIPSCGL